MRPHAAHLIGALLLAAPRVATAHDAGAVGAALVGPATDGARDADAETPGAGQAYRRPRYRRPAYRAPYRAPRREPPYIRHKARTRALTISTNLLGAVEEGIGLDLELGRTVGWVLRARALGPWPHLQRVLLHLGSDIPSKALSSEPETSFRTWVAAGTGLRIWFEDFLPKRHYKVDKYGSRSYDGLYATGFHLELSADVARGTSRTGSQTFTEYYAVPQFGIGFRRYLGRRVVMSLGVSAGPILVLAQDSGREFRRGTSIFVTMPVMLGWTI